MNKTLSRAAMICAGLVAGLNLISFIETPKLGSGMVVVGLCICIIANIPGAQLSKRQE